MTRGVTRALGAVLLLATTVAACGGRDAPRQGDGRTLRLQASGGEGEIAAVEALVAAFEKANPGADVTIVPVASQTEHVAKLTGAFAGGNPPDVFLLNYRRLGTFAAKGVIDPPPSVDRSLFYEATLRAFTFDGTLACLPQNASNMVVYVNPALFRKAGVQVPSGPWSWADLRETAEALAAKDVEAFGFEPSLIRLAPFVWSAGGEIVDDVEDPTAVTLDNASAKAAIRYLLSLQQFGLDATERAAQDPEERFAAGTLAMYLDSRRAVPGFRKVSGLDFDVLPVPADRASVSVLHSDGYCVSKRSANRELAHKLAAFAVSTEGARILAETGRTVPSLKSVADSPAFLDPARPPKSSRVFLDAIPTLRAMPKKGTWLEAESVADDVLEQLFAGRLSIDEAIARIKSDSARKLAAQ